MYVNAYVHIFYFQEGDIMRMTKSMALMAMGAGAVLLYQKYNEPVKRKLEKTVGKKVNQAGKKLEDMM